MMIEEYKLDNYLITTDPAKTDLDAVCDMLAKSYWANARKREVIQRSIENSLCFNMYDGVRQIGFARIITDHAVFAYLCDVFIEEEYRGRGLGKWLMECILSYPSLRNIKRIELATRDAHELYRKYGFTEVPHPENIMQILKLVNN